MHPWLQCCIEQNFFMQTIHINDHKFLMSSCKVFFFTFINANLFNYEASEVFLQSSRTHNWDVCWPFGNLPYLSFGHAQTCRGWTFCRKVHLNFCTNKPTADVFISKPFIVFDYFISAEYCPKNPIINDKILCSYSTWRDVNLLSSQCPIATNLVF